MTHISEPGFSIDLPGDWEQAETDEPGSLVYFEIDGTSSLTVMLLAVKAMFSIADKHRLLTDYMQHRAKYEVGRQPLLILSDQASGPVGDAIEGSWSAIETISDLRQLHRVVLTDGILADFCYEALGMGQEEFDKTAVPILDNATVGVEPADETI